MSKLHQIQKAMEMIGLQSGPGATPNAPKSIEEAQRKTYQFWDTQPVPKLCKYLSTQFWDTQPVPKLCTYLSTQFWDTRPVPKLLSTCQYPVHTWDRQPVPKLCCKYLSPQYPVHTNSEYPPPLQSHNLNPRPVLLSPQPELTTLVSICTHDVVLGHALRCVV